MLGFYDSINPEAQLNDKLINPGAARLWGVYYDKEYY
jgi:hypothetical protein